MRLPYSSSAAHPVYPLRPPWRALLSGSLAAVALTASTGCYSTWDVPVRELPKLNGYRAPKQVHLMDKNTDDVVFDHQTELRFYESTREPSLQGQFITLDLRDSTLVGVLRDDAAPVGIDLNKLTKVEARRFSKAKTVVAVVVPIAVAIIAGVVVGVVMLQNGSGDVCTTC